MTVYIRVLFKRLLIQEVNLVRTAMWNLLAKRSQSPLLGSFLKATYVNRA